MELNHHLRLGNRHSILSYDGKTSGSHAIAARRKPGPMVPWAERQNCNLADHGEQMQTGARLPSQWGLAPALQHKLGAV